MYEPACQGQPRSSLVPLSVLVVDDDLGTRETFTWALKAAGAEVRTAASGADAIRLAHEAGFNLFLMDLELPDMRGIDVVRTLKTKADAVPFVLISAFLTTDVTVEAMKLGALDVLDKPVSVDVLPRLLTLLPAPHSGTPRSAALSHSSTLLEKLTRFADTVRPGSAAERWAVLVLKGCGAASDLNTIEYWAEAGALSYTALRQLCIMVDVRPHDARDFARVFRAVVLAAADGSPLESLLNVSDSRTLVALLQKSGIASRSPRHHITVEEFLRHQQLIPSDNCAVRLLSDIVTRQTPKKFR